MSKTDFELNWDYLRASKVMLKDSAAINLVLVGCGGTGSWLAPAVARVGRLLRDSRGLDVFIHFVDPDLVEEKNVYRQNFSNAEIGESKAFALAFRYGLSWGMPIIAHPRRLKDLKQVPGGYRQTTVFLGCVDRASARQEIHDSMVEGAWWIDAGNEADNGQVLIGCKGDAPNNLFELPGYCSWLPLPTQQHPELLQQSRTDGDSDLGISCAELALRDSQGMAINQRMAAEMADYLVRLLITRDLQKMATYIDLASGVSRSTYITQQAVLP